MKTLLITQREERNQYGDAIESLEANYVRYFASLGFSVISVSNYSQSVQPYYSTMPDGIVLTGGGILAPIAYDYDKQGFVQENRDRVEKELIDYALKTQTPLLGICRGMQQINTYFGGHTSSFNNLCEVRKIKTEHPVVMKGRRFFVNNYHNDGVFINELGSELESIATDKANGVVEAFWKPGMLAVQWHPERTIMDISGRAITDKLIKDFLNGCPIKDIEKQLRNL